MTMPGTEEIRIICAEMQADMRNVCRTLDEMKQYMGKQTDQITETMINVATVKQVQTQMSEKQAEIQGSLDTYTKECKADRRSHEDRISATEGFQKSQVRMAVGAGGVVGFLTSGGMNFLNKLFS